MTNKNLDPMKIALKIESGIYKSVSDLGIDEDLKGITYINVFLLMASKITAQAGLEYVTNLISKIDETLDTPKQNTNN